MFDISIGELGVILVVMLVVLGPQKATETARSIGKWISKIKRIASNISTEINTFTHPMKETYTQIQDFEKHIHSSVMEVETKKEYVCKKTKKPLKTQKKKLVVRRKLRKNLRT